MLILVQFLLRLSFGLATGMAITSPRLVSSGYFRNHLYVVLGLTTLATLVAFSMETVAWPWMAVAAVGSYVGSVCWLYEQPKLGRLLLWIVALCSLVGAFGVSGASIHEEPFVMLSGFLKIFGTVTSGLVLGGTMAAMLLGHWYLNSPGMQLGPLRRLLLVIAGAVILQILVSGAGLAGAMQTGMPMTMSLGLFLLLRWLFGLVGVLVLVWMAWQTLKIPNTQSTTGILYVAVLGTFTGELMALLLSTESLFPL